MKINLFLLLFLITVGKAQDSMDTLFQGGDQGNRINFVFLPEGYTESQLEGFKQFAQNKFDSIFEIEPFYREFKKFFNGYVINAASNQSGIDCPSSGVYRSTRFDGSACGFQVPSMSTSKIYNVVNNFVPDYDVIIVVMNSTSLRAAAWASQSRLVIRKNQSNDIINHEIGHVLGDLADEYSGSGGNGSGFSGKPNSIRYASRNNILWKHWIEDETPIPTPSSYRNVDREAVGLFEGANYNSTGWYRPKYNCLMRQSSGEDGTRLCPVCREAVLRRQFGTRGLDFIDEKYPRNNTVSFSADSGHTFYLKEVIEGYPDHEVIWYLDGDEIAKLPGRDSIHISSNNFPQISSGGGFNLKAEFSNLTPYVLHPDNDMMFEDYNWNLDVLEITSIHKTHELWELKFKETYIFHFYPTQGRLNVEWIDLKGRIIKSRTFTVDSGESRINLNGSPSGLYFYRVSYFSEWNQPLSKVFKATGL